MQEGTMPENEHFAKMAQAVIEGEPEVAQALANEALNLGLDPMECINLGLTTGMNKVGELFASGEYFLPDLIIAGEAMKTALGILEPALMENQHRQVLGHVVLGTVEGDLHEIGKTLVGTMLTANGFDVTDIGVDKSAQDFIDAIEETGATIVGASALLTTTMLKQKELVLALQEAGLRDKVKVLVGGAPVTKAWADEIQADAYAEDAIGAVAAAKKVAGAA
jgi:corrinoid protein of di/trimethylamine methyltransferase